MPRTQKQFRQWDIFQERTILGRKRKKEKKRKKKKKKEKEDKF